MANKCDAWTPSRMDDIIIMVSGRRCQRNAGHYPETSHLYEGQQGNLVLEWVDEDNA